MTEVNQNQKYPHLELATTTNATIQKYPNLEFLDLFIVDSNGIARGKRVPASYISKLKAGELRLIGSLYALTVKGHNVDEIGLAMERGDPDVMILPVPNLPLLPSTWLSDPPHVAAVMCQMWTDDVPSQLYWPEPRAVLQSTLEQFSKAFPGYKPILATELEFYLIDGELLNGKPQPPKNPRTGRRAQAGETNLIQELEDFEDFLNSVRRAATAQGWKTTSEMSEYGAGQFEINLPHLDNVLLAADQAILLKRVVRGCAKKHCMDATFMAKPYRQEPGSGLHVHISIVNDKGENIFSSSPDSYQPTKQLNQALAGLLHSTTEMMPVFAPHPNSYSRLRPKGSYAPTHLSWGRDNRTTALRIVGEGRDTRIEHRLSGADANPYLVIAAILAGIMIGLQSQVSDDCVSWWEMSGVSAYLDSVKEDVWQLGWKPNVYKSKEPPQIPRHLHEALEAMKKGTLLDGILSRRWKRLYYLIKKTELEETLDENELQEINWLIDVV